MGLFKKRGNSETDKVREKALREINKLKKEKVSSGSFQKLNEILRKFLAEKYKVKQSLTIEEIRVKIKNKKIKKELKTELMALVSNIHYIEYNKPNPSRKDFNTLIKKAQSFLRSVKKYEA